ncbi:uncharacterized protein JCM15063_004247, partial [Sporobolomyces koalae]|uniref:uncharacterized protein n=1 Tax=Sporobolomyces koalae TaxID=500713 RepID=UPI00316FE890
MQYPLSQTAAALLQSRDSGSSVRLSSNCPALDSLLTPEDVASFDSSKGLPQGAILELVGPAGVGKSRTAMAFALAEAFKPDGGRVLLLDAEGSLGPGLLYDTASTFAHHNEYSPEQVARATDRLIYRRIDSAWLLIATLNTLEAWLDETPSVNLVILDSISAHLRPTLDLQTKKTLIDRIRSTLTAISSTRRVTFVLTSKMTIKLFGTDNRPSSWSREAEAMMLPTVPSHDWLPGQDRAGEGYRRVLLYFDQRGERLARLLEAPGPTVAREVRFTMD